MLGCGDTISTAVGVVFAVVMGKKAKSLKSFKKCFERKSCMFTIRSISGMK